MEYKELFETGMSFDTFFNIASASEKDKMKEIASVVKIKDEYIERIKKIDKKYNFLLSAE